MSVKSLLELARYGTTGVCSLESLPLLLGWGSNLCFSVSMRVDTVSPIFCLVGDPLCICSSFHVCGTHMCLGIRAVSCFIVFSSSSKVQRATSLKVSQDHMAQRAMCTEVKLSQAPVPSHGCWQNSPLTKFVGVPWCSDFLVLSRKILDSKTTRAPGLLPLCLSP